MSEDYDDVPPEYDMWNILTDDEKMGPVKALASAIDQDILDSYLGAKADG